MLSREVDRLSLGGDACKSSLDFRKKSLKLSNSKGGESDNIELADTLSGEGF